MELGSVEPTDEEPCKRVLMVLTGVETEVELESMEPFV
jgi:hypothetical protein